MGSMGRSLLYLALCLACLLFLGGCAQLTIEPSSLSSSSLPLSSSRQSPPVSISTDPDGRHVWIVGGTPRQGESNIAYCTVPDDGSAPDCVMIVPQ
ncbi:MAG: hypothetical protein WBA57_11640 [Elainellaceae cyanobacterium]